MYATRTPAVTTSHTPTMIPTIAAALASGRHPLGARGGVVLLMWWHPEAFGGVRPPDRAPRRLLRRSRTRTAVRLPAVRPSVGGLRDRQDTLQRPHTNGPALPAPRLPNRRGA